jgi:hypothetical protein
MVLQQVNEETSYSSHGVRVAFPVRKWFGHVPKAFGIDFSAGSASPIPVVQFSQTGVRDDANAAVAKGDLYGPGCALEIRAEDCVRRLLTVPIA